MTSPKTPHLTAEELSTYLAKSGDGAFGERLEEHLSDCPSCRRRLVERFDAAAPVAVAPVPPELRARVARTRPAPRVRRAYWAAAAAVVLAVVGVRWLQPGTVPELPTADVVRAAPPAAGGDLATIAPAPGAVVDGTVAFRWHPVGARRYRLTVLDAGGGVVAKDATEGEELSVALPPDAAGRFFWYVTAEMDDGTTVESPATPFEVRRAPAPP